MVQKTRIEDIAQQFRMRRPINIEKGEKPMPKNGQGQGGSGRGAGQGRGKGGGRLPENCVCTNCGERIPHQPGKRCYEEKCLKCGGPMRGE